MHWHHCLAFCQGRRVEAVRCKRLTESHQCPPHAMLWHSQMFFSALHSVDIWAQRDDAFLGNPNGCGLKVWAQFGLVKYLLYLVKISKLHLHLLAILAAGSRDGNVYLSISPLVDWSVKHLVQTEISPTTRRIVVNFFHHRQRIKPIYFGYTLVKMWVCLFLVYDLKIQRLMTFPSASALLAV